MNTYLKRPTQEGRTEGWKPRLAGVAFGTLGVIKCLAAVLNYGSIGSGFYFVEWQAVVGCLSLAAGALLVARNRWGTSVGLVAIGSLVIGNGYLLISSERMTPPIIYVVFVVTVVYLLLSD